MSKSDFASETRAYVLLNVVEATVERHEGGDLLAVLDQLDTNALTNGRVRLLGLNTAIKHIESASDEMRQTARSPVKQRRKGREYVHLLEHDTLGVGGAAEGAVLEHGAESILLPDLVGPLVLTAMAAELTSSVQTARLTGTCKRIVSMDSQRWATRMMDASTTMVGCVRGRAIHPSPPIAHQRRIRPASTTIHTSTHQENTPPLAAAP